MKLKRLREESLPAAVAMAKHYRDLNQPMEAESICRDVLDVAPSHEDALRTLGLALTDRFAEDWVHLFDEAIAIFGKLPSDYERVYFTGVAWERYAKAQLRAGRADNAVHAYETAIAGFEEAERLGHDRPEPALRYNCCVRAMTTNRELARASQAATQPKYEFGD